MEVLERKGKGYLKWVMQWWMNGFLDSLDEYARLYGMGEYAKEMAAEIRRRFQALYGYLDEQ
jgi:hypothetical protein